MRSTGIDEEDCRALGSLLSASTRLRLLDISSNSLPPMAMQLIVRRLQYNSTVDCLFMKGNFLGSRGTVSLLKFPLAHRLHRFSLTVTGVEDC